MIEMNCRRRISHRRQSVSAILYEWTLVLLQKACPHVCMNKHWYYFRKPVHTSLIFVNRHRPGEIRVEAEGAPCRFESRWSTSNNVKTVRTVVSLLFSQSKLVGVDSFYTYQPTNCAMCHSRHVCVLWNGPFTDMYLSSRKLSSVGLVLDLESYVYWCDLPFNNCSMVFWTFPITCLMLV